MGLLNHEERNKLIDLLVSLPQASNEQWRNDLTADLPAALCNSISISSDTRTHVTSIITVAESPAWAPLPDGTWPVLIVVENVLPAVKGSHVDDDLQVLLTNLKFTTGMSSTTNQLACESGF